MKQGSLFNEGVNISGLKYISEYISPKYEQELIALIDSGLWNLELKRRTQHYGYKYNYTSKPIGSSDYLGEIPFWLDTLCNKLHTEAIFAEKPDQVIINEYKPGQGIAPHIDCIPCFSDTICSLSLISGCVMDLANGNLKNSIYLEPGSLLIPKGEARYKWKHSIAARKSDMSVKRQKRISLTFRKVKVYPFQPHSL